MTQISEERLATLQNATGVCNSNFAQYDVSADGHDFTYEDVAALQDAYYGNGADVLLHMNVVEGWLCWKSLGGLENRKLADKIDSTCDQVLQGEGAKQKCDALHETVDTYAEQPWWKSALKWLGISSAGLVGTWAVFGPGMTLWQKISAKAAAGARGAAGLPLLIMEVIWPQEVWDAVMQDSPSNRYGHNYGPGPSA